MEFRDLCSLLLTQSLGLAQVANGASSCLVPGTGRARGASVFVLARTLEVFDQLRQLVVLGIEIGYRQFEDLGNPLQRLQVGLVYACFVTIDARTRDKLVYPGLDSQCFLRDATGFPRLTEPAAVGGKRPFIDHGCMYFGLPCVGSFRMQL